MVGETMLNVTVLLPDSRWQHRPAIERSIGEKGVLTGGAAARPGTAG